MSDPALAIQAALFSALSAMSSPAGARIYDNVPPGPTFPYVTIGEGTSAPVDLDCHAMTETTVQIDVWSRGVGFVECKTVASAIRALLHQGELTLSGHYVHLQRIVTMNFERDPDGLTSRARISLEIVTQAA